MIKPLETRSPFDWNEKSPSFKIFVVFLAVVLLLRIIQVIGASVRDPLRDVPGPWLARWTRLWYLRETWKLQFEKTNLALHRKHGPIVRLGPGVYSIDDPNAAKIIYGIGTMPFEKSEFYVTQSAPGETTLFTDRNNAHHALTKRRLGATYSASSLIQYENFVDNCTLLLLQRFREISASSQPCDAGKWLQYYAFDVIGEITFSHRFGFLDSGEDPNGLIAAIHQSFAYTNCIGLYSWVHPYAWWFKNLITSSGEKFMNNFVHNHILEHTASMDSAREGPLDFVQKWLNVQGNDPEKMSMREIQIGAGQNVGAGSDTTSATLSALVYYLCLNTDVVQKLRDELAEARRKGELSDMVKYKEAIKLPYLQAVLKEAMRLHTVAGWPLPRVVPKGGAMLAGRCFAEGNIVGINPHVAHRNKAVFGEDADAFRPGRWLLDKKQVREMDRYFMSWGMGSRSCIGKHIALLEMLKVVPLLVENFDMELENPETGLKNINQMVNRVVDLRCYITARRI